MRELPTCHRGDEVREAVEGFLEMRHRTRKPCTLRAWRRTVNNAHKSREGVVEAPVLEKWRPEQLVEALEIATDERWRRPYWPGPKLGESGAQRNGRRPGPTTLRPMPPLVVRPPGSIEA